MEVEGLSIFVGMASKIYQIKGNNFTIEPHGRGWSIRIVKAVKGKGKKAARHKITGYWSLKSAENDVPRLNAHMSQGSGLSRVDTFIPNLEGTKECSYSSEVCCAPCEPLIKPKRKAGDGDGDVSAESPKAKKQLRGRALKLQKRGWLKKYRIYFQSCKFSPSPALLFDDWQAAEELKAADADNHSKPIAMRDQIFREGVLNKDARIQFEAVRSAIKYIQIRLAELRSRVPDYAKHIVLLNDAVFTGTSFNFLMRAHFHEDNVGDGFEHEPFTVQNTSKAQLARVIIQCMSVSMLYARIEERDKKEIEFLVLASEEIDRLQGGAGGGNGDALLDFIQHHVTVRAAFRKSVSMKVLAEAARASLRTPNAPAASTIRDWYNDYQEHGGFKQNLQGLHDHRFFFEEYGFMERFEFYLKYERRLTVACALQALELTIRCNPPKTDEGQRAMNNILPLTHSTVYTWMLKCGCRYSKHESCYYTDQHEADSTKRDRAERYTPAHLRATIRIPVWVSVPLSKATPAALRNRQLILEASGLADNPDAQLPVRTAECPDPLVKIHVDFLAESTHTLFRAATLVKEGRPGDYFFPLTPGQTGWDFLRRGGPHPCRCPVEVCKCHLPIYHVGQDEAIFKQNALPAFCWKVKGRAVLRPKTEGQGVMVSAFWCEYRGVGLKMTATDLTCVNTWRAERGRFREIAWYDILRQRKGNRSQQEARVLGQRTHEEANPRDVGRVGVFVS